MHQLAASEALRCGYVVCTVEVEGLPVDVEPRSLPGTQVSIHERGDDVGLDSRYTPVQQVRTIISTVYCNPIKDHTVAEN